MTVDFLHASDYSRTGLGTKSRGTVGIISRGGVTASNVRVRNSNMEIREVFQSVSWRDRLNAGLKSVQLFSVVSETITARQQVCFPSSECLMICSAAVLMPNRHRNYATESERRACSHIRFYAFKGKIKTKCSAVFKSIRDLTHWALNQAWKTWEVAAASKSKKELKINQKLNRS